MATGLEDSNDFDPFDPVAIPSHFDSFLHGTLDGLDLSGAYLNDPGKVPETQSSIEGGMLDLLQGGYSNDPSLAGGMLDVTPLSNFNGVLNNVNSMDDAGSNLFAEISAVGDISGAHHIVNEGAHQVSCEKITITVGAKTIQLDTSEALNMFTASGLGMLMDSNEVNSYPPPPSSQLEPVDNMEMDTDCNLVAATYPNGYSEEMSTQSIFNLQPVPTDVAIFAFGAESDHLANLSVPGVESHEAELGNQLYLENYITSLDETQIELVLQSLPPRVFSDNTWNRSDPFEQFEEVFPVQPVANGPSSHADRYLRLQPKQVGSLVARDPVELLPRAKR
jgi:hypothetical protein